MSRELTREEKSAIRKLVFSLCANYDREYGCLPLDGPCYMLGKCWTGTYCRYFRDAVLPNDPVLEAALTAEALGNRVFRCYDAGVAGNAALPGLWAAFPPGWPDTVLLHRLRP